MGNRNSRRRILLRVIVQKTRPGFRGRAFRRSSLEQVNAELHGLRAFPFLERPGYHCSRSHCRSHCSLFRGCRFPLALVTVVVVIIVVLIIMDFTRYRGPYQKTAAADRWRVCAIGKTVGCGEE